MINNAGSRTLDSVGDTNGLPNVSAAVVKWFKPLSFVLITKENIVGHVSESGVEVNTLGVWQPLNARQVSYKPEGQRDWDWIQMHCLPDVVLKMDDVVVRNRSYRVNAIKDYRQYGYIEYHLVEDVSGRIITMEGDA